MKILSCVAIAVTFTTSAFGQGSNTGANSSQPLTANEVIDQIKAHVGVPWQQPTVDTFKAGDPQSRVKGIAVTMMATLDVLKRAAANGQNLNPDRRGDGMA